MNNLGMRVFGLAAIMMGVAGLYWGGFAVGWIPIPKDLPGRLLLADLVGALLIIGGVLINVPRREALGAGPLMAVFGIGFVLADFSRLVMHLTDFSYWESSAEQAAITAAAVIAFAMSTSASPMLQKVARYVFGVCLLIFGAAHFVYASYTAAMVPKYLPPGTMFWTYATGIAHAAAGLALLSGFWSLLAMRLLTLMYLIFQVLVHTPAVMAPSAAIPNWIEFVVNFALVGVAWIVADSLAAEQKKSL